MAKILIDTGVFVALFDGDDKFHQKSVDFIKNNKSPLVTTLANITEVLYLLTDSKTQYNFLNWLYLAKIDIVPLGGRELVDIGKLLVQYSNCQWILRTAVWCTWQMLVLSVKLRPLIAIFVFIGLVQNIRFA